MISIIKYTMIEQIRSRIYMATIGLIGLIMGISWLGSSINYNYGELFHSVFAFGMNLTEILVLALALFLPVNHLSLEYEKGTAQVIWAKLKFKSDYLAGKYLAFLLIISSIVLFSSLFMALVVLFNGASLKHALFLRYFFFFQICQVSCVLSITFLIYSVFKNSTLSSLLTLLVVYFSIFLETAKDISHSSSQVFMKLFYTFMYYTMPQFNYFNIENHVIYQKDVSMNFLFGGFLYALLFSSLILFLSKIIYMKKEG